MPPFLLRIQLSRCFDIVCNKHKMQKKLSWMKFQKHIFVSTRFIYFTYNLLHYNASKVTLENHITVNLCINAINIAPKYLNSRTKCRISIFWSNIRRICNTTTKNWVLMCNIGFISSNETRAFDIYTHKTFLNVRSWLH